MEEYHGKADRRQGVSQANQTRIKRGYTDFKESTQFGSGADSDFGRR
jgi:hypothetical protein